MLGERLRLNVPLRDCVAIGVGGVAEYFYVAKTARELIKAADTAYNQAIPFLILGNGNHVVPSDAGYPGLVIKNESGSVTFGGTSSEVIVDSGVSLPSLINMAAGRDLGGLEFLEGLSDTIGGAIYHNVGKGHYRIGDYLKSITLLTEQQNRLVVTTYPGNLISFKKYIKNHTLFRFPIILTARLQLIKRRKDEILRLLKSDNHCASRSKSIPGFYCDSADYKIPLGILLGQSKINKMKVGGACFDQKHPNCLVNRRGASASDIRRLSEQVKEKIRNEFNCEIKDGIEYIGQWS